MSISLASVSAASPSAGGDQDFTISGFGRPECGIFVASMARAAGTTNNRLSTSYGFFGTNTTATTNHNTANVTSRNSNATSETYRRWVTGDELGMRLEQSGGAMRSECNFKSTGSDKLTVTWGVADPQDTRFCEAIFFNDGHIAFDSHVGAFTPDASQDGTTDETGLGFEPDVVFFTSTMDGTEDTSTSDAKIHFGVYLADGLGQGSVSWYEADGAAVSDVQSIVSTSYVGVELQGSGTVAGLEISSIADGFRCTTRDAASGWGEVAYLAIRYGSGFQHALVEYDVPTSTGTDATTGVGFQPDYWLGIFSHCSSTNSLKTNSEAETFGLGFSDGGTNDNAIGSAVEDGAATTQVNSTQDQVAHCSSSFPLTVPTVQSATMNSFDSDGFTLNWTAAPLATTGKSLAYCLRNAPADHVTAPHTAVRNSRNRLIRM